MTVKMKRLPTGLLFCLLTFNSAAQNDTVFNDLLREFEEFQSGIESEYQQFLTANDSLFLQFLEQSWREYKMYELERDVKPKPVSQPVITSPPGNTKSETHTAPGTTDSLQVFEGKSALQVRKPIEYGSITVLKTFVLFGDSFTIQYYPDKIRALESVNEESIRKYFLSFSEQTDLWESNIALLSYNNFTNNFIVSQ